MVSNLFEIVIKLPFYYEVDIQHDIYSWWFETSSMLDVVLKPQRKWLAAPAFLQSTPASVQRVKLEATRALSPDLSSVRINFLTSDMDVQFCQFKRAAVRPRKSGPAHLARSLNRACLPSLDGEKLLPTNMAEIRNRMNKHDTLCSASGRSKNMLTLPSSRAGESEKEKEKERERASERATEASLLHLVEVRAFKRERRRLLCTQMKVAAHAPHLLDARQMTLACRVSKHATATIPKRLVAPVMNT